MTVELYILKIRLLSALRWIKELGFIRIIFMIIFAAAIFKSFLDINNSLNGIAVIILLNASAIYSIHFSRKDGFFLESLNIKKKLFYSLEYFIYSLPFFALIIISEYFHFSLYIFLLLGIAINIKSGSLVKINFASGKSLFPPYAFEWISGVRTNFFALTIIYILGLALSYQLAGGILAIAILTLIISSFFIENEPLLLIESYRLPPKKLILTKVFQTVKIYLIFILPIAIMHLIFFYELWYLMAGLIFLCLMIIVSSVLTKYAFYSEEITSSKMNYIIIGIIVFSIASAFYMTGPFLFPLPFFMMYYLYRKGVKNLEKVRYIKI